MVEGYILIRVFVFIFTIFSLFAVLESEDFVTFIRSKKSRPTPTKRTERVLSAAEKKRILHFKSCKQGETCARVSTLSCGCLSINSKYRVIYRDMLKPFTTKSCPTVVPCAITTAPCPSSGRCDDD